MQAGSDEITRLLQEVREGDREALKVLFPLVYEELQQIAHQRLLKYRPGDTLNTTALVHEAYIKLVDQVESVPENRSHFFALASRAMRFIIVDYARARTAEKRGGQAEDLPLSRVQVGIESKAVEMLALDQALTVLMDRSERLGRLVEYKFFGGLTNEEIALVMGLSVPTIKRDWRRARTWLHQLMAE